MMPIKNNQKQANKKQKRETQCLQWDVPTFWVAQMVKNLPTVQEIQVQSLGQEGSLVNPKYSLEGLTLKL